MDGLHTMLARYGPRAKSLIGWPGLTEVNTIQHHLFISNFFFNFIHKRFIISQLGFDWYIQVAFRLLVKQAMKPRPWINKRHMNSANKLCFQFTFFFKKKLLTSDQTKMLHSVTCHNFFFYLCLSLTKKKLFINLW